MNELSLFSGAGGGLLGTKLIGFRCVGYVERDAYCQAVLQARIRDGFLDPAPIFGDVRQFLSGGWAERYRGLVDVVTAGFPCQPFSPAGKRKAGNDERNLWPETADLLRRVRPSFALLENSSELVTGGYFGTVLGDLAALGLDAEWAVFSACEVGAPHTRERVFILAHPNALNGKARMGYRPERPRALWGESDKEREEGYLRIRMEVEPNGHRVAVGIPNRMERVECLGNSQVPAVVVRAWRELYRRAGIDPTNPDAR